MTTLAMPAAPNFTRSRFGLETNTQRFESPLTKTVQRVVLGGARWTASYTLPKMNRGRAAEWQAFFLGLDGSYGTFYGFDPDAKAPRGAGTGSPLVAGGSQTGSSLDIDGCTAGVTGWLRAGDYFSVGGEMKMLTQDANTNGSGEATLNFKPALRSSPADNAPLTVTSPACTMVLVDDMQAVWEADHNGIYQEITFSGMEVFS
jgi:hypothetical protein